MKKTNRFAAFALAAVLAAGIPLETTSLPLPAYSASNVQAKALSKPTNVKLSVAKASDDTVTVMATWDGNSDYYSAELNYSGLSGSGTQSVTYLKENSFTKTFKQNEGESVSYTIKVRSMDSQSTSPAVKKSVTYMMTGANTNRIKKLVKKKCSKMSDFKKVRFAHDWIVKNVDYGSGNGAACYTFAGAMEDKEAVCQGYTLAFSVFMKYMDIPVKMPCTSDHTWNMVKLGGKWYHVDVTWDDPVGLESITDKHPTYSYFLQSTAKLMKKDRNGSHSYNKSDFPKATSKLYDNNGNTKGFWEAVPGDKSGKKYDTTFKPWKNGKQI